MADVLAPFTGFGDDTNTSVKFGILAERGTGTVPNWNGGPRLRQWAIANSDRTITQQTGRDPWRVTFRVEFESIAEMELMDNLQGTRATLRYQHGMTKTAGGTVATLAGVTYLILPDTLLERLEDETYEVDGHCEAAVTFSRSGESSAYYGFAVYGEDV